MYLNKYYVKSKLKKRYIFKVQFSYDIKYHIYINILYI